MTRRTAGTGSMRGDLQERLSRPLSNPLADRLPDRISDRFSDRGSATVWSVGAIAVLCAVFGVALALGQAVVTRHRAAGAADLAALAAADHWTEGTAAACARAERVAGAQGTRLVRCAIVGDTSDVTAASERGPFTAEVRARAGPAGPVPREAGTRPAGSRLRLPAPEGARPPPPGPAPPPPRRARL
ncbi:Rv3654c family TadE-like protein [Streptomyces sp. NPDC086766]|uniref:Rv3654c family TadE-like protein n=1 Tax=Streptomyces sp. NPDC086766 TaxID=3365754 RepID=UPI0038179486